ncbi:sigma-70 family RNA polymerase sigma factor [Actinokineospora inagensis]|uniref:sigma-70 family RNA polymerase sigma factor n=1 Tax=Actinokineospora inagensis TaxID=103730 RepID=UPI0003F4FCFD|nr:sigma-70 family RNA polymerase sigma factor [Actinokineospora inagensis]
MRADQAGAEAAVGLPVTGVRDERADVVLDAGDHRAAADLYPRLWTLSPAPLHRRMLRAREPEAPEFVTLPMSGGNSESTSVLVGQVAKWNMQWEAAQFRRRVMAEEDLSPRMLAIAEQGDVNVVFIPRTRSRYHEYAPLFHLLPRTVVERHGLPLLHGGHWPFLAEHTPVDPYLPTNFAEALSRAWASVVWHDLMSGSPMAAFTRDDPVRLLAHNLDFWLPAVTSVLQESLSKFPQVGDVVTAEPPRLVDGSPLTGTYWDAPRQGGDVWLGETDAAGVRDRVVDQADADGKLRGIIEAIRTNRVADDFSDRWSYAKEDFERKVHHKRLKIKVTFVEMTDVVPVHGPETEVIGRVLVGDFLTLLKPKDRELIVLLYSGMTSFTDIAEQMGYANHSAVSKRLERIRKRAADFFEKS